MNAEEWKREQWRDKKQTKMELERLQSSIRTVPLLSLSLLRIYIYIYLTKSIKWFTYIVSAFFVIDYIFSRHFPTVHGRGAPRHQKKWTLRHENLLAITSWQQQHETNYFDILRLSMSSSNIKSEQAATTNVKLTHSGDQNNSLRRCLTSNNTSCNNIIMIQSVLQ